MTTSRSWRTSLPADAVVSIKPGQHQKRMLTHRPAMRPSDRNAVRGLLVARMQYMPVSIRCRSGPPKEAVDGADAAKKWLAPRAISAAVSSLAPLGPFRPVAMVVARWSVAAAVPGLGFDAHLRVAISHGGLAGEADTALLIHAEAFDPDFIAEFDDVFGLLDAEVGQFADMAEAVLAGQELNEGAEFLDRHHLAAIGLADLGFGGHAGDGFAGDLHAFAAGGVDVDGAVVLDVDLATGLFDDAFDILATGADERADFLRVDLDGLNARGVFAELLARFGDGLGHLGENMQAGDAGFFQRLGHDVMREAAQLEVELKAGNAFLRAGDFAVHVAESVLPADDIGEELIAPDAGGVVLLRANADADAGDGADHGDAGVHEGEGSAPSPASASAFARR